MKVFVGNLPIEADDGQLRQIFEEFGSVASAEVVRERHSGESRGFGFVVMHDETEAQTAIRELDGSDRLGSGLSVNEARPPRGAARGGRSFRGGKSQHSRKRQRRRRDKKHKGSWGY